MVLKLTPPPITRQDIDELYAEGHETPFHVYSVPGIIETAREFNSAFSWVKKYSGQDYKNYQAVKALPQPEVMTLLKDEANQGADCSSETELILANRVGMEIYFSSNNTPAREFIIARGLNSIINLDDIVLLHFLEQVAGVPKTISFRLNSGNKGLEGNSIIGKPEESKYGVRDDLMVRAYELAREKGAEIFGLHAMLVSNEKREEALIGQAGLLFKVVKRLKEKAGIDIDFVNLGGGVGIPYRPADKTVDIQAIGEGVRKVYEDIILRNGLKPPRIVTECGRAITGLNGWLITEERHLLPKYRTYVGVDACLVDLPRPGLYSEGQSAEGECYHHITVFGKENEPATEVVDVSGSLCENNDKFARQRHLPKTERGDKLAIWNDGAHTWAMGSNYNGRLRHKEFFFHPDYGFRQIRRDERPRDYFATLAGFKGARFGDLAKFDDEKFFAEMKAKIGK